MQKIAESDRKLSLSDYIFRVFLTLVLCAALASIIGNIATNFPMIANVKWVFVILLCLLGLWLVYKALYVELFKTLALLSALCFVILPSWFYGGGDNTITILYLMMMSIEAFLVLEKSFCRWLFTVLSAVSCVALLSIGYYFPHFIQKTGGQNVFMDTLIQIAIVFTVIIISIAIYTKRYRQQHEQLIGANEKLEKLASIDILSGIYNRRKFLEILDALFVKQGFESLYLVMLDIDHFKKINDTCGHHTGDRAIRHVAEHCRNIVGNRGNVGRYGGDEFVISLKNLDDKSVEKLAQQLCEVPVLGEMPIQISGGIAKWQGEEDAEILMGKADDLLLLAKNRGKGRICFWNDKT